MQANWKKIPIDKHISHADFISCYMRMINMWPIAVAAVLHATGAYGACPGPVGDSFCQSLTSSSGYCEPGRWMCASTNVACGCDFRAPVASTAAPPSTGETSPQSTAAPPSTTAAPSSTRETSAPSTSSTTRRPTSTIAPTTSAEAPSTSTTTVTVSASPQTPCGSGPSRPLFIWAEWPDLEGEDAWSAYYAQVLHFMARNCGNFRVTRLIMRVMDPFTQGLWDVSESASFYVDFLSKLPSSVELRIYPYVLDAKAQAFWATYSGSSKPLEGVFKYVGVWNTFLASKGASVRIGGVVVDGEERKGFFQELPSLPTYKSTYNVPNFGVAIGFDTIGSVSQYLATDEFYLEMYDFYVVSAPTLTLVQTTRADTPSGYLSSLDTKTLNYFESKYGDPRFQFMWSVQAKSSAACLYPLSFGCGSSDDFGLFSAQDFGTFLDLAQSKYPLMAGRNHGIFQFSFVPKTWL